MTKKFILDELWEEFSPTQSLGQAAFKELIWHIENDESPCLAMCLAADMGLLETAPYIAKHLKHHDRYERESAVNHLSRLKLPEYAGVIYEVAKYDSDYGCRNMGLFCLRLLIDLVEEEMKQKIAELILENLMLSSMIQTAYNTVLLSIGAENRELLDDIQPPYPDFVDVEKVQRFRDKYNI